MLEKLKDVEKRYEEDLLRLCDPAVLEDAEEYTRLTMESRQLQPLVEIYREYKQYLDRDAAACQMLEETELDPELRELAEGERQECREGAKRCEQELKLLLLPADPNDERNIIMEIRGGAGGEESALFAASLYRMYTMYAARRGYRTELVNVSETPLGGLKEVSFSVAGEGVFRRLKFESGVHRVQRVPKTEAGGRIHTSTVTVAVLPEAQEVDVDILPSDLQIDTFRASGAGGQHINKTESAIRITHRPSGIVVECQDERSQFKNKDKAMRVLRARLYEQKREEQQSAIAADRKAQVGTGDRNERIRTYNFPQGRVTDHRIGLTLYKLDQVMDGDLDELLDALATADRTKQLQAAQEERGE